MSPGFSFFPIYLDELGAATDLVGLAFTIQGFSELPIYLIAARFLDRFGTRTSLVLSFVVFGVRSLWYSVISNPLHALFAQVMHGAFALFLVAAVDYVNKQVSSEWRATGQSLFNAMHMGVGAIIGHSLSGFLYDAIGLRQLYFFAGLMILGVALISAITLKKARDVPLEAQAAE
jgi:PPP family 3-phenylpropionic acid transporter